jgi:hypothetical protein
MSLVRSCSKSLEPSQADQPLIGWTIFDNLFVLNGTVFVVTDFPSSIPDRLTITSTAVDIFNGEDAVNSRTPGNREMQIISTDQAQRLFGSSAESIDGVTVSNRNYLNLLAAQPWNNVSVARKRSSSIVSIRG